MDKNFPEAVRASVFYCRKQLDNSTKFECCVTVMPLREFKCCTYNFMIAMNTEDGFSCETVADVTPSITEAERIFNLLCRHNVFPCHLYDVVSDLIV